MGLNTSSMLQDEDIEQIKKETGFSEKQIKRLYVRFSHLDSRGCGLLSREDFGRIPELAINPLNERIIDSFYFNSDENDEQEGCNFREFMKTLAHFRRSSKKGHNPLNTAEEKLKFIFRIYDLDNDGNITKVDLLKILEMMVGVSIGKDQLEQIAHRTIKDANGDIDDAINFEEFKKVMETEEIEKKMAVRFLH
ncbi:calcineurin B homologous protein 1-like isoform X1 [Xenia sp. Carnegie-2017]|uniref:calcineurin B homologous protein 1-like isoform X1 n=1 Tax=Xenia sp. Carnegie-2017 TaxID=2897299 RepID=UPI001F04EACC|nr:calcineurin B homologous protein 1-like isoform X1 [Xenia sp. Carnegie-2017]